MKRMFIVLFGLLVSCGEQEPRWLSILDAGEWWIECETVNGDTFELWVDVSEGKARIASFSDDVTCRGATW